MKVGKLATPTRVARLVIRTWYFYVLLCSDGSYYGGVTTDLDRRLNEHNATSRGAKYTKARRPVKLVYWANYENRSKAQKAEYNFKKLKRKEKEELVETINEEKI
jgi:putative endonuclease